jgi:hypothetical protein
MAKWQVATVVAFLLIFALTAIITGSALFFIPAVILAVLAVGYALLNRAATHRIAERHDSAQDAAADETEPIPSTHLIPDDSTPAGDTPEAHDEINPHDVPRWDRATRMAAEEQSGGVEGTTGGNVEGEAGGEPMPQGGTAERDG